MYCHSKPIRKRLAQATATSMILAGIIAPSASARFNLEPQSSTVGGSGAVSPAHPIKSGVPTKAETNDFDWVDAGIGAAGTLVLLGIGSGSVLAVRRGHGAALS